MRLKKFIYTQSSKNIIYINGLKQGPYRTYHNGGPISSIYKYKNNLKHEYEIWYYPNGLIHQITFYAYGKRHGKSLTYYNNFDLRYSCYYSNNMKHGHEIELDAFDNIYRRFYQKNVLIK